MNSYLQRLLARTAPGTGIALAPASIPVAPLASPLAALDQRLGLPDFDAPVPSEFGDAQAGEEREAPKTDAVPRKDPTPVRSRPAQSDKRGPELRIVAGPSMPRGAKVDLPQPPEGPELTPAPPPFTRGPLDIAADDLEPPPPVVTADTQSADRPAAPRATDVPEPAPQSQTRLSALQDATEKPLAEQSDDEPAKSRPSGEAESRLHDTPARRLVAPEPAEIAEPAHRQREIPLDVAGLAEADAPASPGTHDLPARVDQPRSSPSVTIEQIVIDVHEPPQPPAAQASKAGSAPLTAAAASVIGPLPVRRSTVSLFGMRRR